MTIQELIREHEFTSSQRIEALAAYDESPAGFERICRKAGNANNPTAALIAMLRQGQHLKSEERDKGKPPADTLDDLAGIAITSYRARIAKYPPIDERGWTDDDAIVYGVWVASTWNNRYSQDDIERAMRIRIGKPWDAESDPALGTGCPPELLEHILRQTGRIGAMPKDEPDLTLAERLLATIKDAA
jgi:hypothetical protein